MHLNSVFNKLKLDPTGKCYYPFFLREPFSLKDFDFCKLIDPKNLKQLKDKKIIPLVCMLSESWQLFNTRANQHLQEQSILQYHKPTRKEQHKRRGCGLDEL